MLTGATAAMIALSGMALAATLQRPMAGEASHLDQLWPLLLSSSVAVLLVMSALHRILQDLFEQVVHGEARARHDATHDGLTGIANRALLLRELEAGIARQHAGGAGFALLFLDLDRFKTVNDTLGHKAGDRLICLVAERLAALFPEDAMVARLGGDEFAVVLREPPTVAGIVAACERIRATLSAPYRLDAVEAHVGVSIGAAIAPPEVEASELMRRADVAMYTAKRTPCRYRLFDEAMIRAIERRYAIEARLRAALHGGEGLAVHFQPQLDRAKALVGLEALLRWRDAELGAVAPREAVAVAEEAGLIDALGERIFREACRAARQFPALSIAVNLTRIQLLRPDLPERLGELVASEGLDCARFELEVTERALLDNGVECRAQIDALTARGFRIALDDFGSGSSSLTYIREHNIGAVKLDYSALSFAGEMRTRAILRANVQLAKTLGLRVIAEGVGDAGDEQIAMQAGCDWVQGERYWPAMALTQCAAVFRATKHIHAA